jgi:biotin operon repressor
MTTMSDDLLFHMADVSCVRATRDSGWKEIHKHLMMLCASRENSGWKKRTGMTQNMKILKHMKAQGSISQREALLDYSVQSLTKRISELREDGHNIHRELHKHPITGQRYARYFIAQEV